MVFSSKIEKERQREREIDRRRDIGGFYMTWNPNPNSNRDSVYSFIGFSTVNYVVRIGKHRCRASANPLPFHCWLFDLCSPIFILGKLKEQPFDILILILYGHFC